MPTEEQKKLLVNNTFRKTVINTVITNIITTIIVITA